MKRKWQQSQVPGVKFGGRLTTGSLEDVKGEVIISLTRGEGLGPLRLFLFMILTQLAKRQLSKNPDLLYAELVGQLDVGMGQTLTVWKKGQEMVSFRDSSWHHVAMNYFRWVLYSGQVNSYFITYKSTKVPTAEEATCILKEHGNHSIGGKQVRRANRYVG